MTTEVESPIKHSIPALRDKLDRNLRIIIVLDDYARGGELKLGGLKFIKAELRERLRSEEGRKGMVYWARLLGASIFYVRLAAANALTLNRDELAELLETTELLIRQASRALERLWANEPPAPFVLSPQEQAEIRWRAAELQKLVDRYCD